MNALYYISGTTKQILWQLGGKRSSFTGTGNEIQFQHDASWLDNIDSLALPNDGHVRYLTLFDNKQFGRGRSTGKLIRLDLATMRATTLTTFSTPSELDSQSKAEGNMQGVKNGAGRYVGFLVGYGYSQHFTEFSIDGQPLRTVRYGSRSNNEISYRVHKSTWRALPRTSPDFALKDRLLYVSWNGATDVAMWQVRRKGRRVLSQQPREGFETGVDIEGINTEDRSLHLVALDSSKKILSTTYLHEDADRSEEIPVLSITIGFSVLLLLVLLFCRARRRKATSYHEYKALMASDGNTSLP
jgi:hypothetical protein